MTITFKPDDGTVNLPFQGDHGCLVKEEVRAVVHRWHPFGANGDIEVRGNTPGRRIHIDLLCHNYWDTFVKLRDELSLYYAYINKHGTVDITGIPQVEAVGSCTFLAIEELPLAGRAFGTPMLDYAGTIDPYDEDIDGDRADWKPKWFTLLRLHFYEIYVSKTVI